MVDLDAVDGLVEAVRRRATVAARPALGSAVVIEARDEHVASLGGSEGSAAEVDRAAEPTDDHDVVVGGDGDIHGRRRSQAACGPYGAAVRTPQLDQEQLFGGVAG